MGRFFPLLLSVTCLFFTLQFFSFGSCKQANVTQSCVAKAGENIFPEPVLCVGPLTRLALLPEGSGAWCEERKADLWVCLCVFRGGPEGRLEESCSFRPISHHGTKKPAEDQIAMSECKEKAFFPAVYVAWPVPYTLIHWPFSSVLYRYKAAISSLSLSHLGIWYKMVKLWYTYNL